MNAPPVRILLVEDSPGDARLIPELLRLAGSLPFEIHTVSRLSDAPAALEERGAQVILLDLDLPDSLGTATLTGMLGAAPDVPVIVLTGHRDEALGVEAVHAGAQDYLVKGQITGELLVRSILYAVERQARERERRRTEEAERFLADAGQVLANSLEPRTTLRTIAELIVPELADWCAVDLVDEAGTPRAVEVVARDPAVEAALREEWSAGAHPAAADGAPLRAVLGSGEPRVIPCTDALLGEISGRDPAPLRILRRVGAASAMLVPMIARGRTLGVLVLGSGPSGRCFGDRDLALAGELAQRAALAIENARLFSATREAQQRAERAAEQLHLREELIASLAAAPTTQRVAAVVVQHGLSLVGARMGTVYLLDSERRTFEILRAAGLPEKVLGRWRSLGAGEATPLAEAVRTGEPVIVRPEEWAERWRGLSPLSATGGVLVAVALAAGARSLGVMAFELAPEDLTEESLGLLVGCAGKCALALERALLYEREQTARRQAERATRARDEILGVVAHDLRNPLGAISSYAALLEGDTSPGQRREHLNGIFAATARMDRLIQDLLDVSRLDAGGLKMDARPEALAPLLHEAVDAVRAAAERNGIAVETSVPESLPRVTLDRDRVLQVLGNLLGNALRFTPAGGSVRVEVEPLGREVLFLVTDTGPGVAPEDQPHLFDRFWQARATRSGGAGLGLAIVKGIVEAHGGRVGVESKPGVGSTFFFALPAAAAPEAPPAPSPPVVPVAAEPEPGAAPGRAVRVLVVDDHPAVRRGLAERIRRETGFVVVGEAGSGEEAVEQARLRRPDVVLMDLTMPGMGGLEAIRQLTARDPQVRVLAVTAEAEEDTLLPVLEAGGSGFVRKTTAYEDLVPAIRTVARDEVFLYPSGNRLLLRDFMAAGEHGRDLRGLSRHERDILALAAEGFSSEEIGRKLFLSPKTVDSYRSRAMRSLGLGHRSDLVKFALRTGLLSARHGPVSTPPAR